MDARRLVNHNSVETATVAHGFGVPRSPLLTNLSIRANERGNYHGLLFATREAHGHRPFSQPLRGTDAAQIHRLPPPSNDHAPAMRRSFRSDLRWRGAGARHRPLARHFLGAYPPHHG